MNNIERLKVALSQTWRAELLQEIHSLKIVSILEEIVGHEYSSGYLTGLALYLYFSGAELLSDDELMRFIYETVYLTNGYNINLIKRMNNEGQR